MSYTINHPMRADVNHKRAEMSLAPLTCGDLTENGLAGPVLCLMALHPSSPCRLTAMESLH